jgi:hypothetical protein
MEKTDEELELQELLDLKGIINGDLFKKYISSPIYEALNELKDAYDCETLIELSRTKGEKKGLKVFTDIVETINTKIENKRSEISN